MTRNLSVQPYIVIDIDVLVKKDILRRVKFRLQSLFVLESLLSRYNYNLAIACLDRRRKKYYEDFAHAYGIGVQRWIDDIAELEFLDRCEIIHGAILGPEWKFDTINDRVVFFYDRPGEIETALVKLQGALT